MPVHREQGGEESLACRFEEMLFRVGGEGRVEGEAEGFRHGEVAVRLGDAAAHSGIEGIELQGRGNMGLALPFAVG